MSKRPWYKRYPADFIAGCVSSGLNLEEIGAYTILLDLLYDRDGPVPNDPQRLARMGGCSTRKWQSVCLRLIAHGKIVETDGYLDNPRASSQRFQESFEGRKYAESGAKGGRKTAENQRQSQENNDLAEKGLLAGDQHARSQIPDTREEEKEVKKKKPSPGGAAPRKRATQISDKFQPSARAYELGRELGFTDDETDQLRSQFVDHWAGKGEVRKDWQRSFYTWIRNETKFGRGHGPAQQRGNRQPASSALASLGNNLARERRKHEGADEPVGATWIPDQAGVGGGAEHNKHSIPAGTNGDPAQAPDGVAPVDQIPGRGRTVDHDSGPAVGGEIEDISRRCGDFSHPGADQNEHVSPSLRGHSRDLPREEPVSIEAAPVLPGRNIGGGRR